MRSTSFCVFRYAADGALILLGNSMRAETPRGPAQPEAAAGESWADRVDLDDLVPYTQPPAGWSDRHSDIALTWTKPDQPGIQRLTSVVGWGGTKITDDLLSWSLSEGGQSLPLKLKHRNYRPDKIIESDETNNLAMTATAAFER